MVVDLSGAKEFGGGSGSIGDWLRPRCLSPILPDPLSSTAGEPEEPNEFELNSIRNDPRKLETIRLRLSNLCCNPWGHGFSLQTMRTLNWLENALRCCSDYDTLRFQSVLSWNGIMARMARAEVFAPDEVAVVHVMNRGVRRCYLLDDDPVSRKNYDHRKVMIALHDRWTDFQPPDPLGDTDRSHVLVSRSPG